MAAFGYDVHLQTFSNIQTFTEGYFEGFRIATVLIVDARIVHDCALMVCTSHLKHVHLSGTEDGVVTMWSDNQVVR